MSAKTLLRPIPAKMHFRNKKRNGYVTCIFSVTIPPKDKQQQWLVPWRPCYGYATTEGGLNPPPWSVRNTLLSLGLRLLRRSANGSRGVLISEVAQGASAQPPKAAKLMYATNPFWSRTDGAVAHASGKPCSRALRRLRPFR
jgi:hypothetical protein